MSALEQVRLLAEFDQIMIEAGLERQLAGLRAVYADELLYILEGFQGLGVARSGIYSSIDRQIVEALIQADFNKVTTTISRYGVDIKAQLARSIIAGEVIQIDQMLNTTMPQILSYAKTEVNTSVQAFNRVVAVKKAVDIFGKNPKFIYIGPDDDRTREFCQEVLSRNPPIYTLSQISGMNNGQLSPVISYGGGYNCRHEWAPISTDLEDDLRNES